MARKVAIAVQLIFAQQQLVKKARIRYLLLTRI
jgi:hypothetical protein